MLGKRKWKKWTDENLIGHWWREPKPHFAIAQITALWSQHALSVDPSCSNLKRKVGCCFCCFAWFPYNVWVLLNLIRYWLQGLTCLVIKNRLKLWGWKTWDSSIRSKSQLFGNFQVATPTFQDLKSVPPHCKPFKTVTIPFCCSTLFNRSSWT